VIYWLPITILAILRDKNPAKRIPFIAIIFLSPHIHRIHTLGVWFGRFKNRLIYYQLLMVFFSHAAKWFAETVMLSAIPLYRTTGKWLGGQPTIQQ
jgi:hypothetical protein